MLLKNNESSWARANAALRKKDFGTAVALYEEALNTADDVLKEYIHFNLALARKKAGVRLESNDNQLEKPDDLDQYFFDLIKQGNFFDPDWYLAQYKEKYPITDNPLAHYLAHGVALGTNPSPDFDTAYYLKSHQDVAESGMHPFLHFVCQGHKESRTSRPLSAQENLDIYQPEAPQYVPRLAPDIPPVEKAVRTIAFYLPQFHPIPENDAWWGKGFTEWTNVRPAQPQFQGHYQPHEPDDFLGYYDLRDTSIIRKQIELAKQYGIEGFCFYTYWFTGTRLLETPVDNYLADATLNHPFCICWANENWSRRWDGLDNDLLMVQHYSDQDDLAFIAHMAKYLRDPRYIRVQGKPLLIIYRPNLFPSMKETAQRWRGWCRENGLGEIYIAYVQSFEKRCPTEYGLDAAIEFPPNNSAPPDITEKIDAACPGFAGKVYDWRVFMQRSENYTPESYTLFRGACPSWDNTARKKERGTVFAHSSPKLFERWLINAFEETIQRSEDIDQRLVFINAWNEWAEGAHLEPDRRHGYAWLQAVRQAHMRICTSSRNNSYVSLTLQKPDDLDAHIYEAIKSSRLFHPAWYLERYKATQRIEGNPLSHYLKHGVAESLNPSQGFDTAYYLAANPDLANADIHPFIHYVLQGTKEGRSPTPASPLYRVEPIEYIPRLPSNTPPAKKAVKVITFYLPQFHPIPENDAWWGKGFTEWTNVRPAKPQFEGHYQPHVPDEFLGYYDLRDTSVMRKQIELAKQYGIEGFCFYTYWFSGHRLLETPVDNYLADPTLDLPFCICWANENWSRRWDGHDNDILISQDYSAEDDLAFIQNASKYLKDNRYVRIQGRPLLLVYRPNLFPNIKETTSRWRNWCRTNGIGEIYLAYPQSFSDQDPADYGMDAAIEFPPSGWYARQELATDIKPDVDKFEAMVYDWRFMLARSDAYQKPAYKLFRGATPSWDNTARRKNKGTVFHHSSPKLFTKWLTNAFSDTITRIDNPEEQIVFVNAWNEWAEGAHLEPDQRYGYAWLQAVRDAHETVLESRKRIIVVGHDALPHGAQLLTLNIIKQLREQLHFDIDAIILGDGPLLTKYAEYASVHRLDLLKSAPEDITHFVAALKTRGAKMAIVNTTVSGKLVPYLKQHGFGVVSLIHEMPGILSTYQLEEHATLIAQYADKIVFAARQVKEGFETFIGKTLPNAIIRPQGLYLRSLLRQGEDKQSHRNQVRQALNIPSDAKIIMCAGYADHRKGFDLFVKACLGVMQINPKAYALWVGHGDQGLMDRELNKILNDGLRRRFLFTGRVETPQTYYLAADVYALTSREDPFPSVVMEALDALTPVVAFKDCGGFEELLNRDCGILVPKDDVTAFSDNIKTLLENPLQALHMAQRGREIVEQELNFRHYLFDLLEYASTPIPTVSAIVPNYNYARYLQDRLETVTNQTLPLYELIVLDDCSTDDSLQVIQNFLKQCDVPWRLEVNEPNSGSVFRQWRKGVELAKGEYVWIAEADDTCKPQFLQRVVSRMQKTGAVLGFADSWQIDEDGKRIGDSYKRYVNEETPGAFNESFVMEGREFLSKYLGVKNVILNVSGVVFRRDALLAALDRVGCELFEFNVAGDWRLYLELCASNCKVVFETESLNGHRRHQSSVTHALMAERHLAEIRKMHALTNKIVPGEMLALAQARLVNNVKLSLGMT